MAGDAGRRLRIIGLAEVIPDREASAGAEPALERGQELGPSSACVAAALADELVLQGVEGVDVVARERRDRLMGVREVGVDALQVDVDVVQDRATLGARA